MAFQQLVQADPATTVKVMNLLKRVQQEPVSEAGVLDYAKAIGQNIGQRVTGQTPTQTIGQAATSSAAAANAKTIGLTAAKQWANKAALLRQQALAAATAAGTPPADPRKPIADAVYKAHLEDFVNRVMFRGDMDALDAASKPQVDNAIAKLVASQGSPGQEEFIALALASLTARTTRPGSTPKPVDPSAPVPTTASVETELAAQGVRIRDNETQMNKALYTAGIDPRIKATGDPRADMLLKRFGYDPR
jgi:hypothetical protein